MAEEDEFFRIDQVIDRLMQIEKDLQLHKLDPAVALDLENAKTRNDIRALITDLDILLSTDTRDPRLLRLVTQVKGLRDFIQILGEALKGSPGYRKWLARQDKETINNVNNQIDRIIVALDEWIQLSEKKVHVHLSGRARNEYLQDLPRPKDDDFFYVMVKELGPHQVKYKHQFNIKQFFGQRLRPTEDLLRFDPNDPIAGKRTFAMGDNTTWPGSQVHIVSGHHRTFEIYRRFLKGEIDGDTLILVKKHFD